MLRKTAHRVPHATRSLRVTHFSIDQKRPGFNSTHGRDKTAGRSQARIRVKPSPTSKQCGADYDGNVRRRARCVGLQSEIARAIAARALLNFI